MYYFERTNCINNLYFVKEIFYLNFHKKKEQERQCAVHPNRLTQRTLWWPRCVLFLTFSFLALEPSSMLVWEYTWPQDSSTDYFRFFSRLSLLDGFGPLSMELRLCRCLERVVNFIIVMVQQQDWIREYRLNTCLEKLIIASKQASNQ